MSSNQPSLLYTFLFVALYIYFFNQTQHVQMKLEITCFDKENV